MGAPSFSLRAAVEDDRDRVLGWANDPETRAASFNSEPISQAAHSAWFAESLAGARHLYIIERSGTPVGLARLDPIVAGEAIVSLTIAPEYRGHGIGPTALASLSTQAARLGISRLLAKIQKSNTRSQRAFERAGYALSGEEIVRGTAALLYVLDPG